MSKDLYVGFIDGNYIRPKTVHTNLLPKARLHREATLN